MQFKLSTVSIFLRITLSLLSFTTATPSFAQPGLLDPSFGNQGVVAEVLYYNASAIPTDTKSVLAEPGGKIITVGVGLIATKKYIVITKYKEDGYLDISFGTQGQTASYVTTDVTITGASMLRDGGVLVFGNSGTSKKTVYLAKFDKSGKFAAFGSQGQVNISFGPKNDFATCAAEQTDGKIVFGGYTMNGGTTEDILIARLTTTGQLDNFFSIDGYLTKDVSGKADRISAIIVQPDQKIIAAGTANYDILAIRYNASGSTDYGFSTDGLVTTDLGSNEHGYSMALQSNGKVLVAGITVVGTKRHMAVVRYTDNGSLDNTFSADGKLTFAIDGTSDDVANDIALQKDGNILLGGHFFKSTVKYIDFALVRLASDGSFDTSFGSNGIVTTDVFPTSHYNDQGRCLAIMPDGKIVLSGVFSKSGSLVNSCITRYLSGIEKNIPNLLEAEGARYPGAIVASNRAGYTGTGFVDYVHPSGDAILWDIVISKASPFKLKFRYANGGTANRPLELRINGVVTPTNLVFAPTGSWTTWKIDSFSKSLPAGRVQIGLYTKGIDGPNIDHLAYADYIIYEEGILEAEKAIVSGAVKASNKTGYTGTGFVDFVHDLGDFIEWTVNATASTGFLLQFRYANGATENRQLAVEVNGFGIPFGLPFPSTGSWTTWSYTKYGTSLQRGANKVRLSTGGFNGPNVDHLAYTTNTTGSSSLLADDPLLPAVGFVPIKATISPNPARDRSRLLITTGSPLPIQVQLVDVAGIRHKNVVIAASTVNTFDFSVRGLPAGMYMVLITQGNSVTVTRLVVAAR